VSNEKNISDLRNKVEQINNVSCSFCTAKWLQTTLYLQNGYNHSCHHPAPHKIPLQEILEDPAALHNSYFKKQQREKMLNGERPSECDYCWKIEDLNKGYFSDRHIKTSDTNWAWDRFDEIARSNPYDNVNPSYLEVSFSNVCNFACAYCSPDISSKWMEDIVQNGPYPIERASNSIDYLKHTGKYPYRHNEDNPYVDAFWHWFPEVFDSLKVFRITGGEPLLSKDTWKLIDWLKDKENKNCTIAFNTNLGIPDHLFKKFIKELEVLSPKFNKIDIFTSLESTGSQAEYARDGINYEKFLENLRTIMKASAENVHFSIMTTVNILSLPSFSNFLEEFLKIREEFHEGDGWEHSKITLSVNYLRWPMHLQCTLLDKEVREMYADRIEALADKYVVSSLENPHNTIFYLEEANAIKRFCDYLRSAETAVEHRADFVKFISAYDQRRNKNFNNTFPEYNGVIEKWQG